MTLKRQLNELSKKAKAFSVVNLLGEDPDEEVQEQEGRKKKQMRPATDRNIKACKKGSGLAMELCSSDLWDRFCEVGTEMIITKAGRRMFPTLKIRFHGLSSSSTYIVYMDIIPAGQTRFRYIYHSSQWMPAGPSDNLTTNNIYIHPDSPATGQLWASQGHISFDKVKLTNNKKPVVRGQISLHSMHRYQPRVHILEVPATHSLELNTHEDMLSYIQSNSDRVASFSFSQTVFITVTAYQNQEITRLKIQSNPFAKGFRDTSRPFREDKEDKCSPYQPYLCARPVLFDPDLLYALHMNSAALQLQSWSPAPQQIPVKVVIPPEQRGSQTAAEQHSECL